MGDQQDSIEMRYEDENIWLTQKVMATLYDVDVPYLDLAEDRAERHIPMTMEDWSKRLDLFLMADDLFLVQRTDKVETMEVLRKS